MQSVKINSNNYMYAPYMPLIISNKSYNYDMTSFIYRKINPRHFGPYYFKTLKNLKKGIYKSHLRKLYMAQPIKSIKSMRYDI